MMPWAGSESTPISEGHLFLPSGGFAVQHIMLVYHMLPHALSLHMEAVLDTAQECQP